MQSFVYVGLDISKQFIDVCINDGVSIKFFKIINEKSGFKNLIDRLTYYQRESIHVCCEYTGIYYKAIANELFSAGIKISVVNAYSIKSYARLTLSRTKTDKQDARLIADYCKTHQPTAWNPPTEEQETLQSLTRRIDQLSRLRTMELNRHKVADSYSIASIERVVNSLSTEISIVYMELSKYIKASSKLSHQHKLLTTIVGIGDKTASILLSVLVNIDQFPSAEHLVSYLGLSPITVQSGSSIHGNSRISKMGDKFIRKSLYLPARTACLRSKIFKDWYAYHLNRGKHPKQIYIMMMHKLVVYAYHVIKNNTPFDPSRIKDYK